MQYDLEELSAETGLPLADLLTMTAREINDLAWATDDEWEHAVAMTGQPNPEPDYWDDYFRHEAEAERLADAMAERDLDAMEDVA